jgi:hypothetical protein
MELLAPDMLEDRLRNEFLALDILERERADSTVELLALLMVEYIREINYLHPSRQSLKPRIDRAVECSPNGQKEMWSSSEFETLVPHLSCFCNPLV